MSTAPHPVAPEEIMALLDGQLPADHAQSVSAHAGSCSACQQELASLRAASTALAAWFLKQPANLEFESRLLEKARAASSVQRTGVSNPPLFARRHWQMVAAAIVMTSLVVGSASLFRSRRAKEAMDTSTFTNSLPFVAAKSAPAAAPMDRLENQSSAPSAARSDRRPISGRSRSMDSLVTLNQPGVAPDTNGLFHGIGDHAENSFSIDGQPLSDQQSKVFSNFSGPMIARTASLAILVKDFDVSRKSLDSILVRYNGYSANLAVSTPQGAARSLQASLRIPAPQLAAALAEIKSLGHVEGESQGGEEVAQQHADLVARLKVSRETEQRFLAILQQHTGDIYQVLAAEQAIARVRGEIEQMEAEQKNLEHRVDFAAIDLHIDEEYKAQFTVPAPSFSTLAHNALIGGYRNVVDTLIGLFLFLAQYSPILLFWAVLLFIPVRFVWRRWRQAAAAI